MISSWQWCKYNLTIVLRAWWYIFLCMCVYQASANSGARATCGARANKKKNPPPKKNHSILAWFRSITIGNVFKVPLQSLELQKWVKKPFWNVQLLWTFEFDIFDISLICTACMISSWQWCKYNLTIVLRAWWYIFLYMCVYQASANSGARATCGARRYSQWRASKLKKKIKKKNPPPKKITQY